MPLVRRTRATLRSAEFGFFGVWVKTRTHTPRFCGLFWSAGLFVLLTIFLRPARTSWLIVGIVQNLAARSPRSDHRPETKRPNDQIHHAPAWCSDCFRPRSLAAWRLK